MDMADCCVVIDIDIEKEENLIMVLIVAVPRSIFFAEQSYCTVLFSCSFAMDSCGRLSDCCVILELGLVDWVNEVAMEALLLWVEQ